MCIKKKFFSLLMILAMVVTLAPAGAISVFASQDDIVSPGDTITEDCTISESGQYYLEEGASAHIILTGDAYDVAITGTGIDYDDDYTSETFGTIYSTPNAITIDATQVPGVRIALEDIYNSVKANVYNVIDFRGEGNVLNIEGIVVNDYDVGYTTQNDANIHVPLGAELTITGDGKYYQYNCTQGAGIGGNTREVNGDIIFDMTGYAFIKGTRQGAVIGAGAASSASSDVPGYIKFNSGTYNILTNSRGAAIGGSAGSTGGSSGTTVYIEKDATLSVNTDYSGAVVGGGGYAEGNDSSGGTLYLNGGSLRPYIDKNAASNVNVGWEGRTLTEGVNDAVITALRYNASDEQMSICKVDVSDLDVSGTDGMYYVTVDGIETYSGTGHSYVFVFDGVDRSVDEIDVHPSSTICNWVPVQDDYLYIWMKSDEEHEVEINGEKTILYKYDADNDTFIEEETDTPTVTVGDVTAHPGESIKVPVSVENNPGIYCFGLGVVYDDSVLTFTGWNSDQIAEFDDLFTTSLNRANAGDLYDPGYDDSTFYYNGDSDDIALEEDGEIFYLMFDVDENADVGEYSVSLEERCVDGDIDGIGISQWGREIAEDVEYVAGTVTIEEAEHVHTWGEPEWSWTGNDDDGYTAAKATFTCSDCDETEGTFDGQGNKITGMQIISGSGYGYRALFGMNGGTVKNDSNHVTEVEVPALGHDWDEGEVTKEPTCTDDGVMLYTCKTCGGTKEEAIPATGHTKGTPTLEDVVAATCSKEGSMNVVFYCTVCNEEIERIPVTIDKIADEHTEGEPKIEDEVAPTCTEAGSYNIVIYCADCGEKLSRTPETIPATGHKASPAVKKNVIEATCEEAGSYDNVTYCSVCGEELDSEKVTVDALGHDWDEGVVTKEATEDEEGLRVYTCKNDSEHKKEEAIPKVNKDDLKAAIEDATTDKDNTKVSEDGTDIHPDDNWVDDATKKALEDAIADARKVVDDKNATQDEVDAATKAVAEAQKAFDDAKEAGKKNITKATGLVIKPDKAELATLDTLQMEVEVIPEGAIRPEFIWISSDEKVATVDENGVVTARTYGKPVTITVVSRDDGTVKASATIQTRFHDVNDKPNQYYWTPVYWAADRGITGGYKGGEYFAPQRNCTRRELITFLWRVEGRPSASGDINFKDISYNKNSDSYKAILWGQKNGIIGGYDDGTFKPEEPVKRRDAMLMLYRVAGKPTVKGSVKFTDVNYKKTSNTYKAILWGTQKKITGGYDDGTFRPDEYCLREHIVTFIYRYDQNVR